MSKKKQWTKPILLILTNGRDRAERILSICKFWYNFSGAQLQNAGCLKSFPFSSGVCETFCSDLDPS